MIICIVQCIVLYISYCVNDFHLSNRIGAVQCAFAAILVFFQFKFEKKVSQLDLSEQANFAKVPSHLRADFSAIKKRCDEARVRRIDDYVIIATVLLVFGELMHGWGDVFISLFAGRAHH